MRDLSTDELGNVYGAGSRGRNCSPTPPSGGRSKSKRSKSKGSRGKKSKSKGSRRRH